MHIARSLKNKCDSFAVEGISCNRYRFNVIDKLIRLTPVVITLQNGKYLTSDDSDKINLITKWIDELIQLKKNKSCILIA